MLHRIYAFLGFGLSFLFILGSCSSPASNSAMATEQEPSESTTPKLSSAEKDARVIIEEAVTKAGLANFNDAAATFRFRDKRYRYQRNNGQFRYERWWSTKDSGEEIRDILTNDGLVRYVNGEVVELTDKQRKGYGNAVNSVIYFAFMPFVLKDAAVIPTYEGRDTIQEEILDRIRVGFTRENGGDDSEDEFLYWFTPNTRQLKYLAYAEPNGKAPRFRVAHNERVVDGVTVRDYHNYATPDKNGPRLVKYLADDYDMGRLKLLSEIDLEEVKVVPVE